MGGLARSASRTSEVPWDVALTLGQVSYSAYSDPEQQITGIKGIGATTVRPIDEGSSHGVVASTDQVVVIGFRGTKDSADWLTDANIIGRRVADGNMHWGFYHAVDVVFDEVYEEAMRQGAKDKAVWITGHSLGGAMAVAFAYRAFTDRKMVADGVVTFGQPLVFSTSLAQVMLDSYDRRYIRFVNNWDPVTRLLPNYRHAGMRVHLKGDEFTIRRPMIAVTAPAGGPSDVPAEAQPTVLGFVEEEGLEPMTEEEFQEFQQKLAAEQAPPERVNGAFVASASIPLITPHLMGTYMERLKAVGEKNKK
jgi:hypothetical protein